MSSAIEPLTDDQGRLVGETVGKVVDGCKDGECPRLPILQRLDELLPFPVLVLDTGTLVAETLDRDDLLLLGEEVRRHRVIGEEEPEQNAQDKRDQTADDHVDTPRCDTPRGQMVDAEGDETAENLPVD